MSRVVAYFRRNGFRATARRMVEQVRRLCHQGRMLIYVCDLSRLDDYGPVPGANATVSRCCALHDVPPADLSRLLDTLDPEIRRMQLQERFARGAALWLARCEGRLAGYGWSLPGATIEPYFFPLGGTDVHLFDFFVFPELRGRSINPILVHHILREMRLEGFGRAFIEAATWNKPQHKSLGRTPFKKFALTSRTGKIREFAQ